jgi:hypothetical protein
MLRSDNRHRDSYLRPTERYQCRPARRLSLVCLNWLAHYPSRVRALVTRLLIVPTALSQIAVASLAKHHVQPSD